MFHHEGTKEREACVYDVNFFHAETPFSFNQDTLKKSPLPIRPFDIVAHAFKLF